MKKATISIFLLLLIVLIIFLIFYAKSRKMEDAINFKEEYESLNYKTNDTNQEYQIVKIKNDNPIKYITPAEAIEIIKNKKGIIYFGANWCPLCRNIVESIIEAANSTKTKEVYYVNMDKYRNSWKVENGKIIKTEQEKDAYYELLDVLESELPDYIITDEDGKTYHVGEKRIYMPYLIAVKDGKVVKKYESNPSLTEKEIMETFVNLMNSIK